MKLDMLSEKAKHLANAISYRWNIPYTDALTIIRSMDWNGQAKNGAEVYTAIDVGRNQLIVAEWVGGDGFRQGIADVENWPVLFNIGEVRLATPIIPTPSF